MNINDRIKYNEQRKQIEEQKKRKIEDKCHPFLRKTRQICQNVINDSIEEIYIEIVKEVLKDVKEDLKKSITKEITHIVQNELKRQIDERVDKIKHPPIWVDDHFRY